MTTLYRQYRPQTFSEVSGQPQVTELLRAAADGNKLTHAYLFYGPRGTGKTTVARLLAKRVNCAKPIKGEPCGDCSSCRALVDGSHVDVTEIDAASNRGIDDIRALRERINLAPTLGQYKVYIVDEVHMLTREAATALLKTLEEPVGKVLFILATTELHKVLPTIMSRCQVYRFRRASQKEMKQRLQFVLKKENREIEETAIDFIIDRSDGCYRDAESLLGQALTLNENTVGLNKLIDFLGLPPQQLLDDFLQGLLQGESQPALLAVDEAFAAGVDPEQFIKESVVLARDRALDQVKRGGNTNGETEKWPQIVRVLLQALQDLAHVPQPMIALHLVVLTLCTKKGVVSKPQTKPKEKQVADLVTVEQARTVWGDLIEKVRETNPVTSTFLRAVEPVEVSGNVVTLRATYPLHKTFFDKVDNKNLVKKQLSDLLGQQINIRCVLDKPTTETSSSVADRRQEEEIKFSKTVKEVFAAK